MPKEMLVIPVNKVVDPKRIIGQRRAKEEEERHKGLLTQKNTILTDPVRDQALIAGVR
jgi:hypothetical protein